MSYTDKKITQEEINAHHVQGATDHLIGNPQQNKAVFDNLPEFIVGKFNDLIDEIAGQHGDEIKVAVYDWLAEHPEATTTVQNNSLTTAKYVDGSVTPAKLDRTYTTPNDLNVLEARMDEFASLPEGSTTADAELADIRVGADGVVYPTAGGAVRKQVGDLKSGLNNTVHYITGKNLFDKNDSDLISGSCIFSDGSVLTNGYTTSYYATQYIPVEGGIPYVWTDYNFGSTMALAFYDSNKSFISSIISGGATGLIHSSGKFIVPTGAKYIRTTGNLANINSAMLVEGINSGTYEVYKKINPVSDQTVNGNHSKTIKVFQKTVDTLSSGETFQVNIPNLHQKVFTFSASCSSIGTLMLANGFEEAYKSGYLLITDTVLSVRSYRWNADEGKVDVVEELRVNHGLDLTGYMSVTVKQKADHSADIILSGKNGKITQSNVYFEGCTDTVLAKNDNGSFTNAILTIFCEHYKKDVWAYGDSYFDMWPIKAIPMGATNILYDAHTGRNSKQALTSLWTSLDKCIPKKILWCMGMNDPDTSEVNADWKAVYDEVVAICETKGIELILCTIPNTPTMENSYKNAIVKASGFRYVDIAAAVGASSSGASWYTGLLSSDNVHPTDLGRQVIASVMIANVPEILAE